MMAYVMDFLIIEISTGFSPFRIVQNKIVREERGRCFSSYQREKNPFFTDGKPSGSAGHSGLVIQ
jgi:hypothetical protein